VLESADLLNMLPHREPFRFVDRVTSLEPHQSIIAERLLRPDEPYFAGHFPGRPIMPGVLIAEALAQTCGLLVGLSNKITSIGLHEPPEMFFLAGANLKFMHPAKPGDLLIMKATGDRQMSGLHRFSVEAFCNDLLLASGSLTLAKIEARPTDPK